MKNNKGVALETAVSLILIAISLGIIIIILFQTGLISSLQVTVCTAFTTGGAWVRGFVIHWIWQFYWILIGLVAAIMFLLGSTCRAFPIGTAVCAAAFAVFVVILTVSFNNLTAGLPLVYCPNPPILHGYTTGCSDNTAGVSNDTFFREIADRSVDCWSMYTAGVYDPLSGKDPPNPVTCFVIDFKLKDPVTMKDIAKWMSKNDYSGGVSYWSKAGGMIIPQNRDDALWTTPLVKGRIFIKYGDDYIWAKWGSADCGITKSYVPPARTDIFTEYYKNILDNERNELKKCLASNPTKICSMSTDCYESCAYVPEGCPVECVYRNKATDPSLNICSAVCLSKMGQCIGDCLDSIKDCTVDKISGALSCASAVALPPHKFPLLEAIWTSATTTKDYVYWCVDKSVTCSTSCTTISGGKPCG